MKSSIECSGSSGLNAIPVSGCTSPSPPQAPFPEGNWGNSTPSWQAARRRCCTSSNRKPFEESTHTSMSSRLWNLKPTTLFAEKLGHSCTKLQRGSTARRGQWEFSASSAVRSRVRLVLPPREEMGETRRSSANAGATAPLAVQFRPTALFYRLVNVREQMQVSHHVWTARS